MNTLTKDLIKLTKAAENSVSREGGFRQKLHLMPPVGWLNDPNGLCQKDGVYHAFFQYSPFSVEGGAKLWGHYVSGNMLDWEYKGACLFPDQPFDCHGVYSGSAYIEDGVMYLYYTGNVKLEGGDYDYVNTGREANTVLVTSEDGFAFGPKKLLMKNTDYPSDLTLHVRDPKVWKDGDFYYMVQGARRKDEVGQAVIFRSEDKLNWTFFSRVETEKPFGYMWECPDYFEIGDQKIFSASVQGLEGEEWENRNVYQSGYFLVEGDILGEYSLSDYRLWDYGFDYYAPQSFETEDGRRIQIGWMGMPDCEEYGNCTAEEEGWQHCFTVPREVFVKDGVVCQRPVREMEEKKHRIAVVKNQLMEEGYSVYEAYADNVRENYFRAVLGGELILQYKNGSFEMEFESSDRKSASCGRTKRSVKIETLRNVRIFADVSSAEVFVNDGEYVFSTRYYPGEKSLCIYAPGADIELSEIK